MGGRDNYVYRQGATANTRLLNTQRVRLYSYDAETSAGQGDFDTGQIGLVQTWNPSETRAIEPHRGIGFGDQIAELGVGITDLTASCSIMMMYLRDIMQVFGYKAGTSGLVRSLKHHRWPFDVKEEIVIPEFISGESATGSNVVTTIFEGCWMSDYSKAFSMGETATAQDVTMMITDVYAGPVATPAETVADDAGNASSLTQGFSTLYS